MVRPEPAAPDARPAADTLIAVELVLQQPAAGQPPAYTLSRSMHRLPAGTTIRQLLLRLEVAGEAGLVAAIEQKARGLSCHGRRAWLDDPLRHNDRIEVLMPILADARQARFERVARSRARQGGRRRA